MIKYQLLLLAVITLFSACQESSSIGNNLLDDERFDIQFTDDFSLTSSTIQGKRIISYQKNLALNLCTVGKLDDPFFGVSTNDVFFTIGFNPFISIPDFSTGTLDSMVFVISYDSIGNYGDRNAVHNLEIHNLEQDLTNIDTVYMDEDFAYGSEILGSRSFIARPTDSVSIINHTDTTAQKLPAQIRVRMNDDWSKKLFEDTLLYVDSESLSTYIKGFYLTNTPSVSALLGLDLSATANAEAGKNRLNVYYTDTDNVKKLYTFRIGVKKGTLSKSDKGSTLAKQLEEGSTAGDSLSIIGSTTGQNTVITFNDLLFLKDKIVNHAKLKFYTAEIANNDIISYRPISQLLASQKDNSGNLAVIKDISDLTIRNISIINGFGGNLTTENGVSCYTMNITNRLKEMIELDLVPEEANIILSPISRHQIPNRTIIFGSSNSQYPITLEVTYTLK